MSLYVTALALTLEAELIVGAFWLWITRSRLPVRDWVLCIIGLNLVSHSLAWAIIAFGHGGFWPVECNVTLFEACGLKVILGQRWKNAALLSLSMNMTTIFIATMTL